MKSLKPILVCGDAMWDHYWFGEVTRISQEAPVPVVSVMKKEMRHGAADNVIANIAALGWPTCSATCNTSDKYRIVARNQQVVRADFDEAPSDEAILQMEYFFKEKLPSCDVVVFSDYGKGSLKNIKFLISEAKAAGKLVLVDPKGYDYKKYAGANCVKPNLDEMRHIAGGWGSEEQLHAKVKLLMGECHLERVLLTRGAEGMDLFEGGHVHHFDSEAKEIFDVTGAGDTAIAALAVSLAKGVSWIGAVADATRASGIVVGKFGTSVCTAEELYGHL